MARLDAHHANIRGAVGFLMVHEGIDGGEAGYLEQRGQRRRAHELAQNIALARIVIDDGNGVHEASSL